MTRSALLVTNTETSPLVPAGTMAEFAVTAPVGAFRVETSGCVCPAGQVVRKPRGPLGATVKFMEYACAVAGRLHGPERTGNVRVAVAASEGPPKGPIPKRVSTRRQGVTG